MRQSAPDWRVVKEILAETMETSPERRREFVVERTGGDGALRAEVESLLAAAERTDALLSPALDHWVGADIHAQASLAGQSVGCYQLERLIAEGATAAIYLARQDAPRRHVVVKILRSALPLVDASGRFVREAVALGRLVHPHVARIYEAGLYRPAIGHPLPFIAMEYVDGPLITNYVKAKALRPDDVIRLLIKVASAVHAAHQQAIIHRDLKPANVLVGSDGAPKVLDFGIARLVDGDEQTWTTSPGILLGTPGYMSPEQALGAHDNAIDIRTDVWALGVLLYELLSGQLPIDVAGVPLPEVVRRIAQENPVPLGRVNKAFHGDLEVIVMKALAREKANRYDSVLAFSDDLSRYLRREPIEARAPTVRYRLAKFSHRNRLGLAVAGAFLVLVVGASGLLIKAYLDARRERDRALAVSALLGDLIASSDPTFGNRDVKMVDVLHNVEARLEKSVGENAAVEADVRSALGSMYFGLGNYEKSRQMLERAVALRHTTGPTDHAALLRDQNQLATTLRWEGRSEEARILATENIAAARRKLGHSNRVTLTALEIHAGCLHDLQDLQSAEIHYRAMLADCDRYLPTHDELTLTAMVNLANVISDEGKYVEAENLQRRALAARHAKGEINTLPELTVRHNLATTLLEMGRAREAETALEEVVESADIALGAAHEHAMDFRSTLAEALRRQGKTDRALALDREIFERQLAQAGWANEYTHHRCYAYLSALLRAKHFDEALILGKMAATESQIAFGPAHTTYHRQRMLYAAALSGAGRFPDALAICREAVAFFQKSYGGDHRLAIIADNNLGICLIEAGQGAEAVEVFQSVLDRILKSGFDSMEPIARRNLGNAYRIADRFDDAEAELQSAWEQSRARGEIENAMKTAEILAELYDDALRPALADAWRTRKNDLTNEYAR
jgi:tetratricopeptide (TPR) repeat protein